MRKIFSFVASGLLISAVSSAVFAMSLKRV